MSEKLDTPRNGSQVLDHYRGMQLRQKADKLSRRRIKLSPLLGAAIALAPDHAVFDNINAFASAYLHKTDRDDGINGRESARLLGADPPAESQALDHIADKKLFRWTMAGLVVRNARRGQYKRAALVAGVAAGCTIRDRINVKMREDAAAEGISVGSRSVGRAKTALFAVVQTLETSSLGSHESDVSQFLDHAMVAVAGLSVASHIDMYRHIQAERTADPTLAIAA